MQKPKSFIEKYIPSVDMQKAIRKTSHVFSDSEKATIIYNSLCPLSEKHCDLQNIAIVTKDEALKNQINKSLSFDRKAIEAFKNNPGNFIYVLEVNDFLDPEVFGYFKNQGTAFAEGSKIAKEGKMGRGFVISKCQLIDEGEEKIKVMPVISSTFDSESVEYFPDGCIAEFEYDSRGNILNYISCEIPDKPDDKSFKDGFVSFPEAFKDGMKVRVITEGGRVGIVRTSEEILRAEDGFDYWDTFLEVGYDDAWDHTHVSPIYLESVD